MILRIKDFAIPFSRVHVIKWENKVHIHHSDGKNDVVAGSTKEDFEVAIEEWSNFLDPIEVKPATKKKVAAKSKKKVASKE